MDSGELRIEKNEKAAGREALNDAELYEELGKLTKNPTERKENIPFLSGLLSHGSVKIQAKALWLPREAGLRDPEAVSGTVKEIAAFLSSPIALLRKRTINALGRIGRGEFSVIEPFWKDMFHSAEDEDAGGKACVDLGFGKHRLEYTRYLSPAESIASDLRLSRG